MDFNRAHELFPKGTMVFLATSRPMTFCEYECDPESWPAATNFSQHYHSISRERTFQISSDQALIYMGVDHEKGTVCFSAATRSWSYSEPIEHTAHLFLINGKLGLRWVPYDKMNVRPSGAFRGLFYVADEEVPIPQEFSA